MSSSTADFLGLSRAILCNDNLLKRLEELEKCERMYRGLVEVFAHVFCVSSFIFRYFIIVFVIRYSTLGVSSAVITIYVKHLKVLEWLINLSEMVNPLITRLFTDFGNIFSTIGVRELQPRASEVFTKFGEIHRQMEQYGVSMIKKLKPVSLLLYVCNKENKNISTMFEIPLGRYWRIWELSFTRPSPIQD